VTKARHFRSQRAEELRHLARILQEADLVRDASPLLSAAAQCGDQGRLSWGYEFAGLEFTLAGAGLRHTKPDGATLDLVELGVLLNGPCLDEDALDDPFTQLNVNIVVTGWDANANSLMTAWHLDKHEGSESKLHHPDYHFHYGGEKVWASATAVAGFSYGSLLLLESPRLDHKPLDGILAVDFVLANFLGSAWRELKEDGRYIDLVREAEKRCHLAYCQAALTRVRR
jgi:hypothetical protein